MTREDFFVHLPQLRDVKEPEEKRKLFLEKLRLCTYVFNFKVDITGNTTEEAARKAKQKIIVELIDHVSSSKIWVSEESLKMILHMIAVNLFRPLPPSLYKDFDPDEDEPTMDPAWYHIICLHRYILCDFAIY